MFPGSYNSLDALCARYNVSTDQRERQGHGALLDAKLLAEVYLQLNGGRERKLDFDAPPAGEAVETIQAAPRAPRPNPLGSLASTDEQSAHAAFIAELGEESIWARLAKGPAKAN